MSGATGAGRLAKLPCGRVTKWLVVVVWIVLAMGLGTLAGKLAEVEENEAANWLPGSAESTQVYERAMAFQNPNEANAVLVYERPSGLQPGDVEAVRADAAKFDAYPEVTGTVTGPITSGDNQAVQLIVPVDLGDDGSGWEKLPDFIDRMQAETAAPDGLTMQVAGQAGFNADFAEAFAGVDGMLLLAALGVVVLILLLSYRSPILWFFPLFTTVVALGSAMGIVYLLAKHAGLTVNAQSNSILSILVIGAGTDYALLLVARYREELREHEDKHEAMAFALHRAGPAMFASGSTVVLGMLCLAVAELNSTAGMGPVLAVGIAVAMLAMLTLLPAILVILGRWIFWPVRPTYGTPNPTETGLWSKVGRGVARRPRSIWIGTTAVLVAATFGVFQLSATGLSNEDAFIGTPDSVKAQRVLDKHFPAGTGEPLIVLAKPSAQQQVIDVVKATPGVVPDGVSAAPPQGDTAFITAVLTDSFDTNAAQRTVDRVRDAVHAVPDAGALVGGTTAVFLDTERAAERDNKVVMPIVLAVVFVILMLLLRAILAPILLILTVVLSFAAAMGISCIVFAHVFGFAGADPGLPLFAFVFLVALGVDYNIFLMTRVREEAREHGTRKGALIALTATGGVITSAGLVLAGTFAVLATIPMVFLAEIGFIVALGVLLDTMIVRSILVTALTLDIGRHVWWPSALMKRGDDDEFPPPPPPLPPAAAAEEPTPAPVG
jgi:RND superfamily putative drug exporter